jgi:hypothetical protein
MTVKFSVLQRNICKTFVEKLEKRKRRANRQNSRFYGVVNLFARSLFFGKSFSAYFFEMLKFKFFSLKFVGCLVTWPLVLTLNPKILGSIPKQLKKANKVNRRPGNQKSSKIFYEIKNKTPKHRCANSNFGRIQWIEVRRCKFRPKLTNEVQVSGNRQIKTKFGRKIKTVYV